MDDRSYYALRRGISSLKKEQITLNQQNETVNVPRITKTPKSKCSRSEDQFLPTERAASNNRYSQHEQQQQKSSKPKKTYQSRKNKSKHQDYKQQYTQDRENSLLSTLMSRENDQKLKTFGQSDGGSISEEQIVREEMKGSNDRTLSNTTRQALLNRDLKSDDGGGGCDHDSAVISTCDTNALQRSAEMGTMATQDEITIEAVTESKDKLPDNDSQEVLSQRIITPYIDNNSSTSRDPTRLSEQTSGMIILHAEDNPLQKVTNDSIELQLTPRRERNIHQCAFLSEHDYCTSISPGCDGELNITTDNNNNEDPQRFSFGECSYPAGFIYNLPWNLENNSPIQTRLAHPSYRNRPPGPSGLFGMYNISSPWDAVAKVEDIRALRKVGLSSINLETLAETNSIVQSLNVSQRVRYCQRLMRVRERRRHFLAAMNADMVDHERTARKNRLEYASSSYHNYHHPLEERWFMLDKLGVDDVTKLLDDITDEIYCNNLKASSCRLAGDSHSSIGLKPQTVQQLHYNNSTEQGEKSKNPCEDRTTRPKDSKLCAASNRLNVVRSMASLSGHSLNTSRSRAAIDVDPPSWERSRSVIELDTDKEEQIHTPSSSANCESEERIDNLDNNQGRTSRILRSRARNNIEINVSVDRNNKEKKKKRVVRNIKKSGVNNNQSRTLEEPSRSSSSKSDDTAMEKEDDDDEVEDPCIPLSEDWMREIMDSDSMLKLL